MTTAETTPAGVNIDNYAENVLEVENLKVYYDTECWSGQGG